MGSCDVDIAPLTTDWAPARKKRMDEIFVLRK